jgi:hypothetical protein
VTSKVPKNAVVVMPCPACGELTVLFREKAIALDRHILEKGTTAERTTHLAQVINEFLESGLFPLDGPTSIETTRRPRPRRRRFIPPRDIAPEPEGDVAISQDEFDRFIQHDLHRIDDPAYFRRHFG